MTAIYENMLTGLPLMNQLMSAAGLELAEVQFTSTGSPSEYLSFPPVMTGSCFGTTETKEKGQKPDRAS